MLNFNLRSIVMLLQHFSEPSNRRLRLVNLPISSVLDWVLISAPIFLGMASVGVHAAEPIDFNRQVRPILADKCFACHGPDEKHREAELRLDVATMNPDSHAIVRGHPEQSEMIARILSNDPDQKMPPPKLGKELKSGEIEILQQWIREGAPYARHWAYVTPVRREPPVTREPTKNWIDAWVVARLEREGLTPSPSAESDVLARRLSFDLLGLPPVPAYVGPLDVVSTDEGYEKQVDQYLASEHFGERMATFWLDLVRYADTVGYHGDQQHNASPYRDYVIDAFNRNLPFDQFTREQLAGDLLPDSTTRQKIASCYNRLLQTSHEGGVQAAEYRAIYQADRVRNLSSVWLGATMGCSQCHDHKFDPYTTKDFYSMAAFFGDVDDERHLRGEGGDTLITKRFPEMELPSPEQSAELKRLDEELTRLGDPQEETSKKALDKLKKSREQLARSLPRVMVTQALATPRTVRILPRGNWLDESGPVVEPAVPEFLRSPFTSPDSHEDSVQRMTRLDLANWLFDSQNGVGGLTARVFVNRVWAQFFGAGLSRTLEDFGGQGEMPTHPELLDALAIDFVESGWNVKHLVKRIVMSRAYRQSSLVPASLQERDPENRLLARQGRWRLTAEAVRDNALAVSGLLVSGRETSHPYQPEGYYQHLNFPKREYIPDKDAKQWERSVYVHWQRQYLHPMLKAFDAPTREECTAQRPRSNTPMAALVLLNDPSFVEAARVLAQKTLQDQLSAPESLFTAVTSRKPDPEEIGALIALELDARSFFQEHPEEAAQLVRIGLTPIPDDVDALELATRTQVARAILNLSEVIARE